MHANGPQIVGFVKTTGRKAISDGWLHPPYDEAARPVGLDGCPGVDVGAGNLSG